MASSGGEEFHSEGRDTQFFFFYPHQQEAMDLGTLKHLLLLSLDEQGVPQAPTRSLSPSSNLTIRPVTKQS